MLQITRDCSRLLQTALDCSWLLETAPDCSRLLQTAPDCSRLLQTAWIWCRLFQTAPFCSRNFCTWQNFGKWMKKWNLRFHNAVPRLNTIPHACKSHFAANLLLKSRICIIFDAEYENRPQNALRLFLNRRFTPTCHCVQNDWIQSRTLAKVISQQICFWIHVSALFLSLNAKTDSKMLCELASNAFQSTFYYHVPLCAKSHFQIALFKCISLSEWSHIWAGFFFLSTLHDWLSVWAWN